MRWPLTFYTDFGVPKGSAGCVRGLIILIRPKYRDDEGLYRHELEHIKQAIFGLILPHALLYTFLPRYRLWCEVQAYKVQARYYPTDRIPRFAKIIAEKYRLKISAEEAERRLRA